MIVPFNTGPSRMDHFYVLRDIVLRQSRHNFKIDDFNKVVINHFKSKGYLTARGVLTEKGKEKYNTEKLKS